MVRGHRLSLHQFLDQQGLYSRVPFEPRRPQAEVPASSHLPEEPAQAPARPGDPAAFRTSGRVARSLRPGGWILLVIIAAHG